MKRAHLAWLLPSVIVAGPLLAAWQQERRGDADIDSDTTDGALAAAERIDGPTQVPAALLADAERERLQPFLVARPDGGAWLGCVEHELGVGDRIAVRSIHPDGKLSEGAATIVGGPSATAGAIFRPIGLLDARGDLFLFWTELVAGQGQVCTSRADGEGFTTPVVLTRDPEPGRNVEAVLHSDGRIWVAWEGWRERADARGSFDILLAPLERTAEGDRLGAPVVVGDGPFSDLDPVLVSRAGRLEVAWCQYAGRDYEIRLRAFDPKSGELAPVVDVTADATSDDLHPSLAARANGELWLAWDRLEDPARGASAPDAFLQSIRDANAATSVSVRLACIRNGEVLLPRSHRADGTLRTDGIVPGAPLFSWTGGVPRLIIDRKDQVHVVYRWLERLGEAGTTYGYPVCAQSFGAEGFSVPARMGAAAGSPEEAAVCAGGDGLLLAWQEDHRLDIPYGAVIHPPSAREAAALATRQVLLTFSFAPSGVGVAALSTAGGTEAGPKHAANAIELVPRVPRLAPQHFHPMADPVGDPILSGRDHFRVTAGGAGADGSPRSFEVFWGDLHRHSSVSRCSRGLEPRPEQRFTFGRDVCLYDFMALTDHSSHVDPLSWWQQSKRIDLERTPGFCTLAGFEWSTGQFGHQNVILRGGLAPFFSNLTRTTNTPERVYQQLAEGQALAIPHHPSDLARSTDFTLCDPRFVKLVEIYQAQRGNYEFDGCYRQAGTALMEGSFAQDALARGLMVGFIASTDHGNGTAYACVLAEKLERGSLFDALLARRTYGATTKGMLVDFQVDGRVMGEELRTTGATTVHLKTRGAAAIAEVVVFRNGKPWQVVGRPPPRPDSTTRLTLEIELLSPDVPPPTMWKLRLTAPEVTFEEPFTLPRKLRDTDRADRPHWRLKDQQDVFIWPEGFNGPFQNMLTRLRLSGQRGALITIEAGTTFKDGAAELTRTVALGDLPDADVRGVTPFGPWRLVVREAPDGSVDLERGLGVRDFEQEWTDATLPVGRSWYYARVLQVDGEMAWSSPIWVTRPRTP